MQAPQSKTPTVKNALYLGHSRGKKFMRDLEEITSPPPTGGIKSRSPGREGKKIPSLLTNLYPPGRKFWDFLSKMLVFIIIFNSEKLSG